MTKGFNIYTGVERTPAALAWMLGKRTELHGEIVKLQEPVADASAKIAKLQAKLASVDVAIGMHAIQVDLGNLPPRQKHVRKVQLPYGAVA